MAFMSLARVHKTPRRVPADRSAEEAGIRLLIESAKFGDSAAKSELIERYRPLVVHYANALHRPGSALDMDDFIQNGCIGLLRAVEKFDPSYVSRGRSVRFVTYATFWIRHVMRRANQTHEALRRVIPEDTSCFEKDVALPTPTHDDALRLKQELGTLPSRHRTVIERLYGLGGDGDTCTPAMVGVALNISRQRVGQIERQALDVLRKGLYAN